MPRRRIRNRPLTAFLLTSSTGGSVNACMVHLVVSKAKPALSQVVVCELYVSGQQHNRTIFALRAGCTRGVSDGLRCVSVSMDRKAVLWELQCCAQPHNHGRNVAGEGGNGVGSGDGVGGLKGSRWDDGAVEWGV